ncbi:MAG: protein disulfide oxidoreductase [Hydrogenovibrio sp.]
MTTAPQSPQTPPDDSQAPQPTKLTQRKWFKNVIFLIFLLGIYLALRPFMQGDVIQGAAPLFESESITGQPIRLADYRGKPVVVHFWATWCPICKLEGGTIEAISKDYPVINIATQSLDNAGLLAYADENNLNPEQIVNDFSGQLMQAYGARAVPATFIIDSDGQIAFVEVGYTTSLGLRARLWWLQ